MASKRQTSYGICQLCQHRTSKTAMNRHLAKCLTGKGKDRNKLPALHLRITGGPLYWVNILVRADATLADLDSWLRELWLECCGHMSAFSIGEQRYYVPFDRETSGELGGSSMDVAVKSVLKPGVEFTHEYDFGTTTELDGKVVGAIEDSGWHKGSVTLLARNEPLQWKCAKCKKQAKWICESCTWEMDNPFYCQQHAEHEEEHDEMLLPVVDSPRMGQCGYEG